MKTVTLINWVAISVYALGILWVLLDAKPSPDRMASGMLMMIYIPLALLALLNYLPYKATKIIALVINIYPLIMGPIYLVLGRVVTHYRAESYDQELDGKANGSYYFKDPLRRSLAAAIAAGDTARLKAELEQPVPNLNASGADHVTLLDFAAMQAKKSPEEKVLPSLQMLIDKGAKIETDDPERDATHFLVLESDAAFLEFLLKNGANANATETERKYPILFKAIYLDVNDPSKAKKVGLLLEHGADPNAFSPGYEENVIVSSVLCAAAGAEQWEICNLLLNYGAKPDYQTAGGWDIRKAVAYQDKQFASWGKVPPLEFTSLKERLNAMR
jgi:ankyrin repeat protein